MVEDTSHTLEDQESQGAESQTFKTAAEGDEVKKSLTDILDVDSLYTRPLKNRVKMFGSSSKENVGIENVKSNTITREVTNTMKSEDGIFGSVEEPNQRVAGSLMYKEPQKKNSQLGDQRLDVSSSETNMYGYIMTQQNLFWSKVTTQLGTLTQPLLMNSITDAAFFHLNSPLSSEKGLELMEYLAHLLKLQMSVFEDISLKEFTETTISNDNLANNPSTAKNKNTPQRKVKIQEIVGPKLELALKFLEYILTNIMTRECFLNSSQKKLNQLLKALGAVKELLTSFLNTSELMLHNIGVNTALKAFSLYCRLTIHFQNKFCADGRTYLLDLESNADWIDEVVLQFLHIPGKEIEVSEHQGEIARQIVDVYLSVCKDIVMVGVSDAEFQAQLLGFGLAVMQSEKGVFSLPILISILKEITVNCLSQNIYSISEKANKILDIIQKVFHKILEILARCSRKNQEETLQKSDPEDVVPPETTDDLPLLSSYFLAINADIIRLWHFHQALQNFDFKSEDSNEVKNTLLQCFMSVAFIKKEEGRRFLSFLFSWDVEFIKMIHDTIKNQLHFFPKSIMTYVAEVYFRAWKRASGMFLKTIEYNCIQDVMHHGVHLPRNSPVHSKVRELLSYFHQQKLRQGVDEMLHRLYQPILWRGLKARNSEVRANAAILFIEAFPIRDPGLANEEVDVQIQRQFEEIFNLLEDPQPLVRSTGVLGVCRIAAKYWEMIPPAILTDLLTTVLCELSADTSSADVRCSVFKCLPVTLDNRMSHPLLEQLLPGLKNSLHDNSEKVRVAFVDMLLKIKAARAAKFWKVCPMEHLLARLELDSRPVARRIVNLLFNSFFPVNQPEEVWCERCVTLVQMNPMAARKFYQYAHEHTAPTNIAKLMLVIRRCLNACIAREVQNEDSGDDKYQMENSSVLDSVLSVNDGATMASLLEIIVILWKSIYKALNENEEANNYTISKFGTVLPEYFKTFTDDRCTVPLVILASFMPATAVPTFSCGVLSKLRNLDEGADENKYSVLIDCLCQWGKVGHVLELITDWLTDRLPQKVGSKVKRTAIKETAVAIHTKFQCYNGVASGLSDIERALYTSSKKHLEDLLHL
ncbi:condensin-2 complex subunit G2 [Rhincodon typus]|uniref:condensin-2 complex subunit G2 n=1 Tax=Rhincodon typus TaxID=259920 RepID=UPI00202DD423|nr:condensin-2 complex subunit G2 [Rhincodon typus]